MTRMRFDELRFHDDEAAVRTPRLFVFGNGGDSSSGIISFASLYVTGEEYNVSASKGGVYAHPMRVSAADTPPSAHSPSVGDLAHPGLFVYGTQSVVNIDLNAGAIYAPLAFTTGEYTQVYVWRGTAYAPAPYVGAAETTHGVAQLVAPSFFTFGIGELELTGRWWMQSMPPELYMAGTVVPPPPQEDVADVGIFSDDVHEILSVHVADVGILSDEVSVLKTTRVDIADTGIFSDRVLLARIEFVIDGGVFADAISAPNQAVHLADGGVFADEVQGVRHPTVTIADVGIMADAVKTVRTATVADAGIMSDDIALMAAINVVDGGEFSDDIFVLRRPRTDVTDTGVLSDETQTYVIARVNIADVGWLSDSIRLSRPHVPPGQAPIVYEDAWTANTDTWGMSRYDNFGMTELAAINGRLYGVNADGVYAITADTDATVPIDAYVQTGLFSNYHRAQQRLTYLYADAQVAGRLSAIVYDVNAGMPGTFSYTFEPRRSGDVASQRAKLGRGLKSGRFSLKVTNVDGANFDIVGLLLLADNNSRRV